MKYLEIKDNKLYIDGISCVALAEKYGTPFFSTSALRYADELESVQNCRQMESRVFMKKLTKLSTK